MSFDSGRLVDAEVPAELRHERIAGLVQEHGFMRVVDLATRFHVSTVTIRSDLQLLEGRGRLHRIRGGAVPANLTLLEPPVAAPNGIVYLRYGLAEGIPAMGDMSAPARASSLARAAGQRSWPQPWTP